jgi:putative endonuclease
LFLVFWSPGQTFSNQKRYTKAVSILKSTFLNLIMFFVYAISSLNRNYIYVGLTDNIERRFMEHNSGKNKTTKPYLPFQIIYTEEFETRVEARLREKYFKSGIGKEKLKAISDKKLT